MLSLYFRGSHREDHYFNKGAWRCNRHQGWYIYLFWMKTKKRKCLLKCFVALYISEILKKEQKSCFIKSCVCLIYAVIMLLISVSFGDQAATWWNINPNRYLSRPKDRIAWFQHHKVPYCTLTHKIINCKDDQRLDKLVLWNLHQTEWFMKGMLNVTSQQ